MFWLGKLLGSYMIGRQRTYLSPLIQQLVSNMATILCLVIVSGILIGAVAVSICVLGYHMLILHGLSQTMALATLGGIFLLLSVVTIVWLQGIIREVRNAPLHIVDMQPRIIQRARAVGDAFLDGLLYPSVRYTH